MLGDIAKVPIGRQQRWYRQRGSTARALGLVVEPFIPFERAHQLEQALLPPSRDELLERLGDGRLFGALAAHRQSAIEQIGIDRQVRRRA